MLKVVRTRKVRAITERFYGRTAGMFYAGRRGPGSQVSSYCSGANNSSIGASFTSSLAALARRGSSVTKASACN